MFNSAVVDVAIGLVFVYLLLGLMCTTVNEWIAQLFNTRAATLKEGIRRLLQAPPDGTYAIRPMDINAVAMAKRLSNPDDKLTLAIGPLDVKVRSAIDQYAKSSATAQDGQLPSDVTVAIAEKVTDALRQPGFSQLIDLSRVAPETKAEIGKNPKGNDLLRVNRALLTEAYPNEFSSLSDAFYSHPLIKSLGRPGKHPSYVPSTTFARTLLDIFAKGQELAGTSEQKAAQIKSWIAYLPDSDVKKSLQALLMQGSDSIEEVQNKIEDWFNDSMDRVSGWYKNRVQVWTVVIAVLVTIVANADTIQIAEKLMINPALRGKIVQEASSVNNPGADSGAATLTPQQEADLSSVTGWTDEFRTFHHIAACADTSLRGAALAELDCRLESEKQAAENGNPKFFNAWNSNAFPGMQFLSRVTGPWLWAVIPPHLVGWILTAIAASLGAPFWFDTLNKFMNVRAAGTSPVERNTDKSKA